jgi:hypothetical protein
MGIREELQAVLKLQAEYDSSMTDAMRARGDIIRNSLPSLLSEFASSIQDAAGIEPADFMVEGRDGTGLRSQVPWVRFASRSRSPKATAGWYVVLLFREDGSGLYLALSHASTRSVGGEFVSRAKDEADRLVGWARATIADPLAADGRLAVQLRLGKGDLAKAYESTTAAAYFYSFDNVPSDDQLRSDVLSMAALLRRVYGGEVEQVRTAETSLDVIAAVMALEVATTGRPSHGQGLGLSQAERRAVELRAMAEAVEYFEKEGFHVEDTSAVESYDLKIRRGETIRFIEVKGTTGRLGDIVLTRNEVSHHVRSYPNNGLFVLHEICLTNSQSTPLASGGKIHVETPWLVDIERLSPLAYRYRIG